MASRLPRAQEWHQYQLTFRTPLRCGLTSGTFSLSVCEEAASVVTVRRARGTTAFLRSGEARLVLSALPNIVELRWCSGFNSGKAFG